MSLTNVIKDAINLTNDVARLSDDVKSLARDIRETQQKQTEKIHELDKRIFKLENMLEFAEKLKALENCKNLKAFILHARYWIESSTSLDLASIKNPSKNQGFQCR